MTGVELTEDLRKEPTRQFDWGKEVESGLCARGGARRAPADKTTQRR